MFSINKTFGNLIRLFFGGGVIFYLFMNFYDKKIILKQDFNSFFLSIGILIILLSFSVVILRFNLLISEFTGDYAKTAQVFLIGWFFTNILPTNFGGDGYMIYALKKEGVPLAKASALITLQRILSLLLMFIYIIMYFILKPALIIKLFSYEIKFSIFKNEGVWFVIILSVSIILFFFRNNILFFLKKTSVFFKHYLKTIKLIPMKSYLYLISLSIIYQSMRIAGFYFLVEAFGYSVNVFDLFFILFITTIFSMIPISVGGLGVQESIIVFGFSLIGIPVSIAILVSFINRGIFIFFAIIGGIVFIFRDKKNHNGLRFKQV
jgi:uncharacterized protein (TIRG00374 family)